MLPAPNPENTIVVTGASSGIGRQIATSLAKRGYNLTLVARRKERLAELASELIEKYGVDIDVQAIDLTIEKERIELVEKLKKNDHRIIGLVNNAGYGSVSFFAASDLERERGQVALNIDALVSLTRLFVPLMLDAGGGSVLNVASTAAFQPVPTMATYAATKAFVLSFSRAIACELEGTGVSVTCVCPGPTKGTEFGVVASGSKQTHKPSPLGGLTKNAEQVAESAVIGMIDGKELVIPGIVNRISAVVGTISPPQIVLPMLRRIGGRRLIRD